MSSLKTVCVDFVVKKKDLQERKTAVLHVDQNLMQTYSIQEIAENVLTSSTIETKAPIVVTKLPKSQSDLSIEEVVERSLFAGPLKSSISYVERVLKLFENYKVLYFPIIGWMIALVWALFLPKEGVQSSKEQDLSQAVKMPETALALMSLVEKHAEKFQDKENFKALALHAKDAREWTKDLLSGKKTREDLQEKLDNLETGESFSLVLGYWRKVGFCPLILTVRKNKEGFSLDSFCVDAEQGPRSPAHRSWSVLDSRDLTASLFEALSFAKEPQKEHFSFDIKPQGFFQGALFNAFAPNLGETPPEEGKLHDPSTLLFSAFEEKGCVKQSTGKEVKTDRWERVIKHWQRTILIATPEEEALFQANIKLSLMTALIQEIKDSKTTTQEKWQKLSALQNEVVSLRNTAKKELADPILGSSFIAQLKDFDSAITEAFASLIDEVNRPLKPQTFPKALVLKTSESVSASQIDVLTLRECRETIIKTKSLDSLPTYVKSIESLVSQKQWRRVSDSVTALFALLPSKTDLFWENIPGEEIPKLSKQLTSLFEFQAQAELHLSTHSPSSYVTRELYKIHQVMYALHIYRKEHIFKTVFAPKLDGKSEEDLLALICSEDRSYLEKKKEDFFHGGNQRAKRCCEYFCKIGQSNPKRIDSRGYWAAKLCKKLGIERDAYLQLISPDPDFYRKSLLTPLCLTPEKSRSSQLSQGEIDESKVNILKRKEESQINDSFWGFGLFDEEYSLIKRDVFIREANYFSEKVDPNTIMPETADSLFRSLNLLKLLLGQGDFISKTPPSEALLSEIDQEIEKTGYRGFVPQSEKLRIAQRRKALEEMQEESFSFTEDYFLQGKLFPDTAKIFSSQNYQNISMVQMGSALWGVLSPVSTASSTLEGEGSGKIDGYHAAIWQNESWKFGLKGRLPIDFLCSRLGTRGSKKTFPYDTSSSGDKLFFGQSTSSWMIHNGFSETPEAFAMMESESPTFEKLPTLTLTALRYLVSGNQKLDATLINRFCQDHKEHLEHEEVQRRIEYAAIQSGFNPEGLEEIIEWAILEKRFKTAGFLLFLHPSYNQKTLDFYKERLQDKAALSKDKKFFGSQVLKLLQDKGSSWTLDEWKLALSAYVSIESSIEEVGTPDLQVSLLMRMREEFLPQLNLLKEEMRNEVLSEIFSSRELLEWEPSGENWKVKDQSIFFMTDSGVILSNGSVGPIPDSIALHPDFIQAFGREKRIAKVEVKEGRIRYQFDSYTIESDENGLILLQEIEGKSYRWERISFSSGSKDSQFEIIEKAGVWKDLESPLQGKIILGKMVLQAQFKQVDAQQKSLQSIKNQKGHELVFTENPISLIGFGNSERTLLFVDRRKKLQEAFFVDLNMSMKRAGSEFFLEDEERKLKVVSSQEEQTYAIQKTTAKLPEYGILCSDEGRLQLQLFFSKKRPTSRALTLYLEKPRVPGAPAEMNGSAMSFLFLSEQAAEEGQFEKAAEYIQKALLSPHAPQENLDFDWFVKILDSFETNSFPAKVWKLKCLIAVMKIGQDKLQKPVFDARMPTVSLKRAQGATLLWNEILKTLSNERKKRRVQGILSLTEEENDFLKSLSAKSLAHFLPLKAQEEKKEETKEKPIGSLNALVEVLLPWDYLLFVKKPNCEKSIFSLPIYPVINDLLDGFTSFAHQLSKASPEESKQLIAHLKKINIEDMHFRNRVIAKTLMKKLLSISELSKEERVEMREALEAVEEVVEEPLPEDQKQNSFSLEEMARKKIEVYKKQFENLCDIFPDKDLEPIEESLKKPPVSPEETGPSFLDLVETSPLTLEEKAQWKDHVAHMGEAPKELVDFLRSAGEAEKNFVSLRIVSEVERELRQLQSKKSDPVAFPGLTLPTTFNMDLFEEEEIPAVSTDFATRLKKEEKDLLVRQELERIENSEFTLSKRYLVKNKQEFEKICQETESILTKEIQELIYELGRTSEKNREYSDFERFEMLVDRYVVENHPEQDVLVTRALNALVALNQVEKRTYEGLLAAFDENRLDKLSPCLARAVLVGEYRSGNVSRPFQPKLVEQLVHSENGAILSPPGSGKTTTILPAVAQVIAKEQGKFPVVLLTEELFGLGKEGFDATTKKLFHQAGLVFDFDRNSPKDEVFLAQEVLKIRKAKAAGHYIVTTVGRLASLENELILKKKERDSAPVDKKEALTKQVYWLKQLWKIFQEEDVRFIADEIDELYEPTIDYNYALGLSAPIDEPIQKACFEVMDILMQGKDLGLQVLSRAIKQGNLAKISPEERENGIKHLARIVSMQKWGVDYSLFLTDLSQDKPFSLRMTPEVTHLRELLSTTLKNMPLSPDSQYGPSESGITTVPKRKARETPGTRFSDPYELALVHYLYYSVSPPSDDYLTAFWMENESLFRKNPVEAPWDQWASLWKSEIKDLPADLRYQKLNALLKKEGSLDQRLCIIRHDILKKKIKLFPEQIKSNAHALLKGRKVCGASGTINPDALGSDFKADSSLMNRMVMKKVLSQLDPEKAVELISSSEEFFKKKAQDLKVVGIIDQAGLQKNRSSLEMARLLRTFSEGKRQILFIHPKHQTQWMWNPGEGSPRPFRQAERQADCLCYFGEAECRGTDWVLPSGELAFVVNPSSNDNDFLQSYGRARRAGTDQVVTLAAEKGFLPSQATYFDLMQRVIQNGPKSRSGLNVKSLLRDQKAIVAQFIRDSLFSSEDETLFSQLEKYLIQTKSDKIHSKSRKIPIKEFLLSSLKTEEDLLRALPLRNKEKVLKKLEDLKKEIQNLKRELKGLPEDILVSDLASGNTETVQEQQEVQEQVVQQQQESLHFSLDRNRKYSRDHDVLRKLDSSSWSSSTWSSWSSKSTFIEVINAMPRCDWMLRSGFGKKLKSSKSLLSFLKKREGLQGKSPFLLWNVKTPRFYSFSNEEKEFTLVDPLHCKEMQREMSKWGMDLNFYTNEFFILPKEDLGVNGLPFDLVSGHRSSLKMDHRFWMEFAKAKIELGYWTFKHSNEALGLESFLRAHPELFEQIEKDVLSTRFGKSFVMDTAEDRKKVPGWIESDLYKMIQKAKKAPSLQYLGVSFLNSIFAG